jgi:hypothetical protein
MRGGPDPRKGEPLMPVIDGVDERALNDDPGRGRDDP